MLTYVYLKPDFPTPFHTMKVFTWILFFVLVFTGPHAKAQMTCDSIDLDTIYVSGQSIQLTVYNSSHRFIVYPFFTLHLDDNPYIQLEDSLTVPSFLSVVGDFNNGYTSAGFHQLTIAPSQDIPLNTLFTGTLTITDPNDSTFYCSKLFSFTYGEMLTSVFSPAKTVLEVYPNPSVGLCIVEIPSIPADLFVVDEQGRLVMHKTMTELVSQIQLEHKGLYFIRATSGRGTTTQRLVVQ